VGDAPRPTSGTSGIAAHLGAGEAMVEQLDGQAAEHAASRHHGIQQPVDWPPDFFNRTLPPGELEELRAAGMEMEEAILSARRTRQVPPL
jgi:hypothetical protein